MKDIFLNNLPFIDLHGFDTEFARVATNDFIDDSLVLKYDKVLIIHGKGKGLVKKSVYEALSHRREVIKFHTDNLNDGCTIVYLTVDK